MRLSPRTAPLSRSPARTTLFTLALTFAAVPAHADLTQRWSFNNTAGAAASGTTLSDSVGSTVAIVRGQGATFNNRAEDVRP
jgi:hypothetical protein